MINVYILYNDTEKSKALLADCVKSLEQLNGTHKFNIIPVLGYRTDDALGLYEEHKIPVIPFYKKILLEQNDFSKEVNAAMCATMGHAKIWQHIKESGQPGIVLEHDAIFKSIDFDLSELEDFMIFWLGPRIEKINDYEYPKEESTSYYEVLRHEGVHSYAITQRTANHLLSKWSEYGFVDSIDGFLAMRNYYKFTNVVLDPPVILAAVNRDGSNSSSIEDAPATWNSKNFDGFIKGFRGKQLPPERIVVYENKKFMQSFPWFTMSPPKILAISFDDGTAIKVTANALLSHIDESRIDYICCAKNASEVAFKTYFSNYYYKIKGLFYFDKIESFSPKEVERLVDLTQYDMVYLDLYHFDRIDSLYYCLRILNKVDWLFIFFEQEESDFLDILEEMGYKVQALGNCAFIMK